ncbi:MAG: hypothetical protein IH582_12725 [Afipia sp.]|nr:hypothetical protein [Afipia sp.]
MVFSPASKPCIPTLSMDLVDWLSRTPAIGLVSLPFRVAAKALSSADDPPFRLAASTAMSANSRINQTSPA